MTPHWLKAALVAPALIGGIFGTVASVGGGEVSLAAFLIACASLISGMLALRQKGRGDAVTLLGQEIDSLRRQLTDEREARRVCNERWEQSEAENRMLTRENIRLHQQLEGGR